MLQFKETGKLRFFLWVLLSLVVQTSHAWQESPQKVLFVGNSYTYFWNLPQTVEAMAMSKGKSLEIRQSTAGGATLQEHWDGKKELKSRSLIEKGNWDIVIIQNHSLSAIEDPEGFMEYGKRFVELVRKSGASPMLYMTWAREANPLQQSVITSMYNRLGKETGTPVVSVGLTWEQVRQLRPGLKLFDPDGSHPSPLGTYLSACHFFTALTGLEAEGLPHRITNTDKNGEKLYLNILSEEDAAFLQAVSDRVSHTYLDKKDGK